MTKEAEIILDKFDKLPKESQEIFLRFITIQMNGPEELYNRINDALDAGKPVLAIKLIKGEG